MADASQPTTPSSQVENALGGSVVPSVFSNLSNNLSPARMGRYLIAGNHDHDRAVQFYLWNVALSEAFNLPLRVMEIAVRNQIHRVLQQHYTPNWHQHARLRQELTPRGLANLTEAENRAKERYSVCTIDQVVATLSFGFWSGLVDPDFERILWRQHLQAAFPNLPGNYQLADVRKRIRNANWFRNRIAHHEPIYDANLTSYYSDATTVTAWICSDLAAWVRKNNRVPAVIRMKP